MKPRIWQRRLGVALAIVVATAATAADEEAQTPSQREEQFAAEFNDPLTTVPQIVLKDVYTPANYGTQAPANRLIARLLIPRVPRISFMPDQLIRPTFQLVTVPTGQGRATRTELGDIQLFDLAVLPWSSRAHGFFMGFGPAFVFPTATHPSAGQGAWQVGPALGTVYKGIPGVLLATLIQNPISFAYTSSDRPAVNTLLVQPIALAYVGRGFYVKSADATWAMGWRDGSPTTIPLSLGVGYVLLRPDWPVLNFSVSGEWMAYRRNTTIAPQTSVNFGLSLAFPNLRPWE
jgi:hypothetical protein